VKANLIIRERLQHFFKGNSKCLLINKNRAISVVTTTSSLVNKTRVLKLPLPGFLGAVVEFGDTKNNEQQPDVSSN
jgi:hypothetical protein